MQTTRPLFQLDPGWLFVLAGLGVCAAGVLLPAQTDLESLQRQVAQLRSEEVQAYARLKAHADFMDQMDQANPGLIRRLAAAQLNIVPQGDTPVLLSNVDTAPVTNWIDNTVQVDIRPPKAMPSSKLSRLANGPNRLWMFGCGIMAVFVGLMLSPMPAFMRRDAVDSWEEPTYDPDEDQGPAVATLEPLDELIEPAEAEALLELLETDEAVDGAADAMLDEMNLLAATEVAVMEPESESLDSFELAPEAKIAVVETPVDAIDDEQSADDEGITAVAQHQPAESDEEESFDGCLTIAEDQATDEDASDVLQREVDEYSRIEGDDGYVFEDVDDDADRDTPETDDDDEDEDDDEDGDSNSSFGSNPFRR